MNPYAAHLGTRDPIETITSTAGRLAKLWDELGPAGRQRAPAPGKWTPREIVCHLADTEITFAFRLRQALAEPHHVIQPMDQNQWALQYGLYDGDAALATFTAVRAWNVALIRHVPPEALDKPVTHPERGEETFRVLLETIAGHDLNHLGQIEKMI